MTEIPLRVLPRDHEGPVQPGDVYYADFLKDWIVVLPIPKADQTEYRDSTEFALNTVAGNGCTHPEKPNRHRCWTVTGDKELEQGDASKLTVRPSILITYDPGKTIHGYITDGKWRDC